VDGRVRARVSGSSAVLRNSRADDGDRPALASDRPHTRPPAHPSAHALAPQPPSTSSYPPRHGPPTRLASDTDFRLMPVATGRCSGLDGACSSGVRNQAHTWSSYRASASRAASAFNVSVSRHLPCLSGISGVVPVAICFVRDWGANCSPVVSSYSRSLTWLTWEALSPLFLVTSPTAADRWPSLILAVFIFFLNLFARACVVSDHCEGQHHRVLRMMVRFPSRRFRRNCTFPFLMELDVRALIRLRGHRDCFSSRRSL